MNVKEQLTQAMTMPFGKVLADTMASASFVDGVWSEHKITPLAPLQLSPGAHVFHYASSCFEGMKAHRGQDGRIRAFRMDRHMARFRNSAEMLCLPFPADDLCNRMIRELVSVCDHWVPEHPGTLYIRPTLIGTEASIGSAASPSKEALLYVVISPVGDYFQGGQRPLKLMVEAKKWRTSPEFGQAKAGSNYAAALKIIQDAKKKLGVDQVLFAPGGDVQETGAANFIMLNDRQLITKPLDNSFLPGITRDSILKLAQDLGYEVVERKITLQDLWEWIKNGEAALTGTAAVLAGVGTLVYEGKEILIGDGGIGPNTQRLRTALLDIQKGLAPDTHSWMNNI